MSAVLEFERGTLVVSGLSEGDITSQQCAWDQRAFVYRAPASAYGPVVRSLVAEKIEFIDKARAYEEVILSVRAERKPRPYQSAAIKSWLKEKSRGVVVLPTGSGKSHVAVMAMLKKQRSTLVVAPTLDLVRQWYDLLRSTFAIEVGVVGGGEHTLLPITVTTYDSAYLHMEKWGNRFGLVVFDEVHHLPSQSYALIARLSLAPFRLGLTATLERADGREEQLNELIGPLVYEKKIQEMSGEYLAEYETQTVVIHLSEKERAEYEEERGTYLKFIRSQGIYMGSPQGFSDFIKRASRTEAGREALRAYRRQKSLAFAAEGKLEYLDHLLWRHRNERALIFTQDNATAYDVSRRFLLPVITHQTKVKERSAILEGLAEGRFSAVVTSKVLNEGVDVPTASVAVILSGSGSVMEHVQRLGRVLRKQKDKRALLYELVAADTSETNTSERRRDHDAYRRRSGWRPR